jgi:hypothetical protein
MGRHVSPRARDDGRWAQRPPTPRMRTVRCAHTCSRAPPPNSLALLPSPHVCYFVVCRSSGFPSKADKASLIVSHIRSSYSSLVRAEAGDAVLAITNSPALDPESRRLGAPPCLCTTMPVHHHACAPLCLCTTMPVHHHACALACVHTRIIPVALPRQPHSVWSPGVSHACSP